MINNFSKELFLFFVPREKTHEKAFLMATSKHIHDWTEMKQRCRKTAHQLRTPRGWCDCSSSKFLHDQLKVIYCSVVGIYTGGFSIAGHFFIWLGIPNSSSESNVTTQLSLIMSWFGESTQWIFYFVWSVKLPATLRFIVNLY